MFNTEMTPLAAKVGAQPGSQATTAGVALGRSRCEIICRKRDRVNGFGINVAKVNTGA